MKALPAVLSGALLIVAAAVGYLFFQNQELTERLKSASETPSPAVQQRLDQYRSELAALEAARADLERQLQHEIEQGQAAITRTENELNVSLMGSILFSPADAHLTTEGAELLKSLGKSLGDATEGMIHVVGHTDSWPIGDNLVDKYPSNWELAAARAISVAKYLKEAVGIDPSRMYAISAAQYQPVADNEDFKGRAQNRRIEITLVSAGAN